MSWDQPLQDLPPNKTLVPSTCTPECHRAQAVLHFKVSSIQLELSDLQSRYDDLLRVKERAEARYRSDYKKWKEFKVWLFDSNKKHKLAGKGMGREDKRVHDIGQIMKNVKKFEQTGLPSAGGDGHESGALWAYADFLII
jgi:hypothetical protein